MAAPTGSHICPSLRPTDPTPPPPPRPPPRLSTAHLFTTGSLVHTLHSHLLCRQQLTTRPAHIPSTPLGDLLGQQSRAALANNSLPGQRTYPRLQPPTIATLLQPVAVPPVTSTHLLPSDTIRALPTIVDQMVCPHHTLPRLACCPCSSPHTMRSIRTRRTTLPHTSHPCPCA